MRKKLKQWVLVALIAFHFFAVSAQEKYALLVGINNYYIAPGVLSGHCLRGCVNDVNSMKALFINRFGFREQNVQMITDAAATKKNVVGAMLNILTKCRPGDAFVFYFSGHGVWMSNEGNSRDPIKRGMNQAMVMNDLYTEHLSCLFTDAMLKKMVNRFVDKKVIATTIADCCFSGNLPMATGPGHNSYTYPEIDTVPKSIDIHDIDYTIDDFQDDTLSKIDYKTYYELYKADDTTGVKELEYALQRPEDTAAYARAQKTAEDIRSVMNTLGGDQYMDTSMKIKDLGLDENILDFGLEENNDTSAQTRSYNLRDLIEIFDPEKIPRPSERPNSKFLSLAATNDVEKGMEIKDSYGNFHGAFTNALLNVYKKNSADMAIAQLEKKIKEEMKPYSQTPTFISESSRDNGNLLGIQPMGFSNIIKAKCISIKKNIVGIDIGNLAGISNGNYFVHRNRTDSIVIQLDSVGSFTAFGKIKRGNPATIKAGDLFILTKNYVRKTPVIKIYIPQANFSYATFNDFFNKKISPLVKKNNYSDLKNFDNGFPAYKIFYGDVKGANTAGLRYIQPDEGAVPFFVLMPVPSYLGNILVDHLRSNPDVQLVSSQSDANFVLYLNYIKRNQVNDGGFVFSLQNFNNAAYPETPYLLSPLFSIYPLFAGTGTMNLSVAALNKLAADISTMISRATEYTTGRIWVSAHGE
jgi:hypothetical protein